MNTLTPETDEWIKSNVGLHVALENAIVHMRKLELQRDDLQNAISGLCKHFKIHAAGSTFLAVAVLRIERQRNVMAEILRDILAYNKGDKPHDYWALQNGTLTNAMAFDAWQEILRKIEQALETKP